jgi:hypothetical protein
MFASPNPPSPTGDRLMISLFSPEFRAVFVAGLAHRGNYLRAVK